MPTWCSVKLEHRQVAMDTRIRCKMRELARHTRNRTEPSYVIAKVKRKLQYKMSERRLKATDHMMMT